MCTIVEFISSGMIPNQRPFLLKDQFLTLSIPMLIQIFLSLIFGGLGTTGKAQYNNLGESYIRFSMK